MRKWLSKFTLGVAIRVAVAVVLFVVFGIPVGGAFI
jgi:hypothetical protein